ncbi:Bestrophin, RFP-TM, chloride channel-domain-containing protein [Zopfochytrium polystomum]|nr:Bestrophin, RFP-TM, chloride channel-domain-containing protein [Zopfochytrium polystomum]
MPDDAAAAAAAAAAAGVVGSGSFPLAAGGGVPMAKAGSRRSRTSVVGGQSGPVRETTAESLVKSMRGLTATPTEMRNVNKEASMEFSLKSWLTLFSITGSVIPGILIPTMLLACWATIWTVVYTQTTWRSWATPPTLISVISFVLSLMLVFRTNTAYDRYWEGRRTWSAIKTHGRNLARAIWIGVVPKTGKTEIEKRGALNLVLAFAVATKHYLRDEPGVKYNDLAHLVMHVPSFHGLADAQDKHGGHGGEAGKRIPVEVLLHLMDYVRKARREDLIDITMQVSMMTSLNGLTDCLTALERIRNTPIPLAYSIHLKQIMLIFLLALPFEVVSQIWWATIPIVLISSFTLFGVEAIAAEIENPFGYDINDLRLEGFCTELREELHQLSESDPRREMGLWGDPVGGVAKKSL